MNILMKGYAGLSESGRLAGLCRPRLPERILQPLEEIAAAPVPAPEGEDVHCLTPIEEGGVWAALWRLADMADEEALYHPCGLRVLQNAIPIRQETIEICELLEQDPYRIPSGGWLFVTENSFEADGTVIGQLQRGRARTVEGLAGTRYLEKPR